MRRAIVLGLLQGPTEMAPISSSAHTVLLRRPQTDAAFAKSFEVALHGGTALALAAAMGGSLRRSWDRSCAGSGGAALRRRMALLALSLIPPAIVGALLERPIERRLGGPRPIAVALVLGAAAMAAADRRPRGRTLEQARPADGIALGIAQAVALAPGVSRHGATLTAARWRGFGRRDADALSWLLGLPVMFAACALKALRLLGAGTPISDRRRHALIAGAGASFASTFACAKLLSRTPWTTVPLTPFCAYRVALALALVARARSRRRAPADLTG